MQENRLLDGEGLQVNRKCPAILDLYSGLLSPARAVGTGHGNATGQCRAANCWRPSFDPNSACCLRGVGTVKSATQSRIGHIANASGCIWREKSARTNVTIAGNPTIQPKVITSLQPTISNNIRNLASNPASSKIRGQIGVASQSTYLESAIGMLNANEFAGIARRCITRHLATKRLRAIMKTTKLNIAA